MPSEPELDPQTDEAQTVPARRRCRHIFTAGNQCGSPCLRKEQFCYYHHTTRRPVADPITRVGRDFVYNLPNPEDRASILAALAQVMQAVARQNVDPRTAGLLLYSLQIALCALPKEPSMSQPQSRTISAAASRTSTRNAVPAKRMPALPPVDEIFVDETHGLIAPEAWLVEEDDDEEEAAPPRRSLARQLLDEVEAYEARQAASAAEEAIKKAAYEEGRAAAFKELETRTHQTIEPEAGSEAVTESVAKPAPTIIPEIRACCRYATRHRAGHPHGFNLRAPHLATQMWDSNRRARLRCRN